MSIGDRIRYFGITVFGKVKEFAGAMEMAPPNLQKYMNDEREPGVGILQKLHGLGCSIDWLISGEGEMLLQYREGNRSRSRAGTKAPEQRKRSGSREEVRVIGSAQDLPNISIPKVSMTKLKKMNSRLKETDSERL